MRHPLERELIPVVLRWADGTEATCYYPLRRASGKFQGAALGEVLIRCALYYTGREAADDWMGDFGVDWAAYLATVPAMDPALATQIWEAGEITAGTTIEEWERALAVAPAVPSDGGVRQPDDHGSQPAI